MGSTKGEQPVSRNRGHDESREQSWLQHVRTVKGRNLQTLVEWQISRVAIPATVGGIPELPKDAETDLFNEDRTTA